MSLADPLKKMSKSYGDRHIIRLMESEESLWEKIRSAVTDVGPRVEKMSPGVQNFFVLLRLVAPTKVYEELMTSYGNGALRYDADGQCGAVPAGWRILDMGRRQQSVSYNFYARRRPSCGTGPWESSRLSLSPQELLESLAL